MKWSILAPCANTEIWSIDKFNFYLSIICIIFTCHGAFLFLLLWTELVHVFCPFHLLGINIFLWFLRTLLITGPMPTDVFCKYVLILGCLPFNFFEAQKFYICQIVKFIDLFLFFSLRKHFSPFQTRKTLDSFFPPSFKKCSVLHLTHLSP